jgi:hypothetical protein
MKKILTIRGTEVNEKEYYLTVSKKFIEEITPENIEEEVMNYLKENYGFKGEIIRIDFKSEIKSIFVTLNEKIKLECENKYNLKENDVIRVSDINILWIYSEPENDLISIRILNTRDKFWNIIFLKSLIRSIFITKGLTLEYNLKERNFEIFLSKSDLRSFNKIELMSLILYSEKSAENLDLNVINGKFKDIKDKLMNDSKSLVVRK